MEILTFTPPAQAAEDKQLDKLSTKLSTLITDLQTRDIPEALVADINTQVAAANTGTGDVKAQRKQVRQSYNEVSKIARTKLKLVPKGFYRVVYMPLGMAGIGLPMGVAFAMAIGNMGLMGIGLPIGLVFGMIIGSAMDNKAAKQGRQLGVSL